MRWGISCYARIRKFLATRITPILGTPCSYIFYYLHSSALWTFYYQRIRSSIVPHVTFHFISLAFSSLLRFSFRVPFSLSLTSLLLSAALSTTSCNSPYNSCVDADLSSQTLLLTSDISSGRLPLSVPEYQSTVGNQN